MHFLLRSPAPLRAFVLVAFAPVAALAQSDACGSPTIVSVAAGVAQSDRVDATISPAQFSGRGADYSIGIDHSTGKLCLAGSIHGGVRTLGARSVSVGRERLIDAGGAIALLRPLSDPRRASTLALGVELRAAVAATAHTYADVQQSVAQYRLGVLSVGPAARWRLAWGRSIVVAQLSSPVASLVEHPYTAIWSGNARLRPTVASLRTLRGARGGIVYSLRARRDMTLTGRYDVSATRYDDARPVRALTQVIAVGVGFQRGQNR